MQYHQNNEWKHDNLIYICRYQEIITQEKDVCFKFYTFMVQQIQLVTLGKTTWLKYKPCGQQDQKSLQLYSVWLVQLLPSPLASSSIVLFPKEGRQKRNSQMHHNSLYNYHM